MSIIKNVTDEKTDIRLSGSYKQEELNMLAMEVIRFIRDYYPDKMAIVSQRSYFKRSIHEPRLETLSKIIYRVTRVRERWVTCSIKHPVIIVEAIIDPYDGTVTLRKGETE